MTALALSVMFATEAAALAHGGHGWDDDECEAPSGDFTSFLVVGAECASPVAFCTRGILTGELPSTYDFMMLTQTPAPTPEHPSRVIYTGISTVETSRGTLYGEDSGEMWFEGPVAFITTVGVIGGDECFEDVSGSIVATGVIDLATGDAVGTYTSELCDVDRCFDDGALDEDDDDHHHGHHDEDDDDDDHGHHDDDDDRECGGGRGRGRR
jgi:hypothetical protein